MAPKKRVRTETKNKSSTQQAAPAPVTLEQIKKLIEESLQARPGNTQPTDTQATVNETVPITDLGENILDVPVGEEADMLQLMPPNWNDATLAHAQFVITKWARRANQFVARELGDLVDFLRSIIKDKEKFDANGEQEWTVEWTWARKFLLALARAELPAHIDFETALSAELNRATLMTKSWKDHPDRRLVKAFFNMRAQHKQQSPPRFFGRGGGPSPRGSPSGSFRGGRRGWGRGAGNAAQTSQSA